MRHVYIFRQDYKTYYAYRKAIREYRNRGWFIARVYGGVIGFESIDDLNTWRRQK